MKEIYVHVAEGEPAVYPEDRIPVLLGEGTLTPETFYWCEGMAEWQPLRDFKPAATSIVPKRRTEILPGLSERPASGDTAALPRAAGRRHGSSSSRRFRFRRQPQPLHAIFQIVLTISLLVTVAELALGLLAVVSPEGGSGGSRDGKLASQLTWAGLGVDAVLLIVYLFWLHRTVQNCRYLISTVPFSANWAVGCHFVPVLNLFRPYQMMQDIWRVSCNPRGWQRDSNAPLVATWWTFGLLVLALGEGWLFLAGTPNQPLAYVGIKLAQALWCGLFLAMATLIVRRQTELVRSSMRPRATDVAPTSSQDTINR